MNDDKNATPTWLYFLVLGLVPAGLAGAMVWAKSKDNRESAAFDAGARAFYEGQSGSENPYPEGSAEAKIWSEAYVQKARPSFESGKAAFQAGQLASENPYPANSGEHLAWGAGYTDQFRTYEKNLFTQRGWR